MKIRNPSLGLLLGLGALLLGYPFVEQSANARTIVNVLGIVVIVLATRMISHTRADNRLAWFLAALPITAQLWYAVQQDARIGALVAGLQALFYGYVAWSYVAYMRRDDVATIDEIYAAAATFIVFALFFACLFWLLDFAAPGSFVSSYAVRESGALTWYEFVYLSFTTLSTTGFGDTAPVTSFARALVMAEQFVGVMYVALVIAHLTSGARRR